MVLGAERNYNNSGGIEVELLFLFAMAQEPLVGQGLLIMEASRPHSYTPYSVRLLWTSYQCDAETTDLTTNKYSQERERDIPVPRRIRTRNLSERAAADSLTVTI